MPAARGRLLHNHLAYAVAHFHYHDAGFHSHAVQAVNSRARVYALAEGVDYFHPFARRGVEVDGAVHGIEAVKGYRGNARTGTFIVQRSYGYFIRHRRSFFIGFGRYRVGVFRGRGQAGYLVRRASYILRLSVYSN